MSNEEKPSRRQSDLDIGEIKLFIARLEPTLESMNRLLAKHDDIIHGNGKPGLVTKLDRLEQAKKTSDTHAFAGWTALIGVAIKSGWDLFTK